MNKKTFIMEYNNKQPSGKFKITEEELVLFEKENPFVFTNGLYLTHISIIQKIQEWAKKKHQIEFDKDADKERIDDFTFPGFYNKSKIVLILKHWSDEDYYETHINRKQEEELKEHMIKLVCDNRIKHYAGRAIMLITSVYEAEKGCLAYRHNVVPFKEMLDIGEKQQQQIQKNNKILCIINRLGFSVIFQYHSYSIIEELLNKLKKIIKNKNKLYQLQFKEELFFGLETYQIQKIYFKAKDLIERYWLNKIEDKDLDYVREITKNIVTRTVVNYPIWKAVEKKDNNQLTLRELEKIDLNRIHKNHKKKEEKIYERWLRAKDEINFIFNLEQLLCFELNQIFKYVNRCSNPECSKPLPYMVNGKKWGGTHCPDFLPENINCRRSRERQRKKKEKRKK